MANSTKIALWTVLGVLHLPTLALPWLYWCRRHYDPLRTRRPALFTQCLVISVGFIWQQVLRNALGAYIGAWFDMVIGSILLLAVFESFFVFALSLYVAYNKTKEQMSLYQALSELKTATPADVDQFMRSIRWWSFLMSNQFAFRWVWGNTAVWMVLVLAYASPTNPYYSVPLEDVDSGHVEDPFPLFNVLIIGRCLITIICLVVTSLRLRIVQDAFGTKMLLKRIGMFTTCSTTFYMLGSKSLAAASPVGIPYLVNMVGADYVICTAFLVPWWQAVRGAVRMLTVAENSTIVKYEKHPLTEFELFLQTNDGFTAFKAHLEKEFSVENLLFWKEVMGFRGEPTNDNAWAIFDKYLSQTAPLEVNLPSASLKKFRDDVFKSRDTLHAESDMFDDASTQLVKLMEVNSLHRFQETNPPSWIKFIELRQEQKAMEHAGELRKTMIRATSHSMRRSDMEVQIQK